MEGDRVAKGVRHDVDLGAQLALAPSERLVLAIPCPRSSLVPVRSDGADVTDHENWLFRALAAGRRPLQADRIVATLRPRPGSLPRRVV
jgi:hypothetical protein